LLNNTKFYIPPPGDGVDFKELFKRMTAAGAGRPLGADGFPAGPWTPELLAEAISNIDSNRVGVDLRTVQLWFQENDKGISTANIRWLARIFGCDNPQATSEWQMALSTAYSRLSTKRRHNRKIGYGIPPETLHVTHSATDSDESVSAVGQRTLQLAIGQGRPSGLALRSEALFSSGSPLNLPAAVFAGATALGFLSYVTGVHSVTFTRMKDVTKQVGFLWAPNWTIVFMVLLPLFIAVVIELLIFWKSGERLKLGAPCEKIDSLNAWRRIVESSASTYWAVFVVCIVFAGVIQWIEVCLVPLVRGNGDYAMDWGKIAIVHPDVISVPEAILFTGLSYAYMAVCFYLFFVGLILLYSVVNDFSALIKTVNFQSESELLDRVDEFTLKAINAIFRCTILGLFVAICMKTQSAYLSSPSSDIATWLVDDMFSAISGNSILATGVAYRNPTHYSSLLVVVSTCIVFAFACMRLGISIRFRNILWRMAAVVTLLLAAYLLIDAFSGFSILLALALLCALVGLLFPGFGSWKASDLGAGLHVS
jgi:hypothetical protein